jgi:flagellar motility protein MotE (MotC chaperone)
MKKLSLVHIVVLLSVLLIGKLVLSGFYLKSGSPKVSAVNKALAGEKTAPKTLQNGLKERLRKKEIALNEKEAYLKKREAELLPLKEEVEAKMEALNELQTSLAALAKDLAERENALKNSKMQHLVSLYSAMDPNKAAGIMNKLKLETVVLILRHMKGKSAGQILGMMDPEKGALISEGLSRTE